MKPNPYFVRIPSEGVVYGPRKRSGETYTRKGAMTFARIGSAHGAPREVYETRGGRRRLIRRYVAGEATYRRNPVCALCPRSGAACPRCTKPVCFAHKLSHACRNPRVGFESEDLATGLYCPCGRSSVIICRTCRTPVCDVCCDVRSGLPLCPDCARFSAARGNPFLAPPRDERLYGIYMTGLADANEGRYALSETEGGLAGLTPEEVEAYVDGWRAGAEGVRDPVRAYSRGRRRGR